MNELEERCLMFYSGNDDSSESLWKVCKVLVKDKAFQKELERRYSMEENVYDFMTTVFQERFREEMMAGYLLAIAGLECTVDQEVIGISTRNHLKAAHCAGMVNLGDLKRCLISNGLPLPDYWFKDKYPYIGRKSVDNKANLLVVAKRSIKELKFRHDLIKMRERWTQKPLDIVNSKADETRKFLSLFKSLMVFSVIKTIDNAGVPRYMKASVNMRDVSIFKNDFKIVLDAYKLRLPVFWFKKQ